MKYAWSLGLAFLVSAFSSPFSAAEKPNVLFIAVDDLRCELGCYGVKEIQSPQIDRLAASGVLFQRAYCQQAVCNPSRASLITGLRPDQTKIWDLVTEMRSVLPDVITLPQYFRQHGYRANAFGKITHNPFPDAPSWDEPNHFAKDVIAYSDTNKQRLADYRTKMREAGKPRAAIQRMRGPATEIQEQPDENNFDGRQTTLAIAKMQELAKQQAPFFLAVGYIRPHLPWITPKPYWDLYEREKIPLASNGFMPRNAPAVAFGARSMGGFYELRDYLDYADAPSPFERPLTESQQRELKHGYYASVSFIDAQIGRLLQSLEQLNLDQKTIVVLWSDHGWKLGEHGGWCKQTNYEIDTRVPLIIRAPSAKSNGQATNSFAELIDLYPTLCDLAGLPIPSELPGKSLRPILENASVSVKPAAFSQFPRKHEDREYMGYAIRTDRYRYVEWLDRVTLEIHARELYDHQTDPQENENLAMHAESDAIMDQLQTQMWQTIAKPNKLVASTSQANPASSPYVTRSLVGWTVHIRSELLAREADRTEHALSLLETQLQEINRVVPKGALAELHRVPLWISPPYPKTQPRAEYHPGEGWLKENGRDPAMVKGVEFTNVEIFEAEMNRMPNFALHELAHAYHDRVLEKGFANEAITAAFDRAKQGGLYESVDRWFGNGKPNTKERAYAMTSPMEYFAECSEAYFSRNDFFPFEHAELKRHDPQMFDLLEQLWQVK